jgi:hypothetical protein
MTSKAAEPSAIQIDQPQLHFDTQLADWTRSDEYHNSFLIKPDPDLQNTLRRSHENGLPDIGQSTGRPQSHGRVLISYSSCQRCTRKVSLPIRQKLEGEEDY